MNRPALDARRRGPLALALVLASLAASGPRPAAALPPDPWDSARDPAVAVIEQKLDEAAERLDEAAATRSEIVRRRIVVEARDLLESLGRLTRPTRARLLLGRAYSMLDDDARVIATLAPALAADPDAPDAAQAFFELAVAYARADRPRDEIAAYDRLLERQHEPGWRHVPLSNRAESRAKIGDFVGAVADYRASIALAPDDALPRWGLAVALDRTGDLARALEEGGHALAVDAGSSSVLDRPGVFFVPAYERWWYHALRQLTAASRAQALDERSAHLETAARLWQLFVEQAPSSDRWVPLARARMKHCENQLARLRSRARPARAPTRAPTRK